ncbi:nitric-oxide reductase large subunit [Halopiger aswanensis]|uniref:Nitric oxide reductase subunit B n=1 Tax=Halopiger aswanensis TaxID=148449 RepID=A0A419WIJ1_9EURY|nr:cbb3-type cytochrome c oxidase subunit I [Halopiger aswanensis]RKD95289.1 nitric oxide reductase subunit B [Halopiger aswanensis]
MRITDRLLSRDDTGETWRRRTDFVTDRLEAGAKTVDDLCDRSRERLESARDKVVDRAVTELCERAAGRSPEDLREEAACGPDGTDPIDRALERFVRRYDLDEARLDERTLDAIRERLATEVGLDGDVDVGELLERLTDGDSPDAATANDSTAADPLEIEAALTELRETIQTELDLEPDQSLEQAVAEIGQCDAVVVGHALERLLTEEIPRLVDERTPDESSSEPNERELSPASPTETDRAALEGGTDAAAQGNQPVQPRSVATAAATMLALLADDGGLDPAAGQLLSLLGPTASSAGDASDTPIERALVELVSSLLLEGDGDDGFDLTGVAALRSRSKGSLALIGLFVANLVAMSIGAWLSRQRAPPIPDEIRGPDGEPVVTAEQVRQGKKAFQANGLMNHGSVLGNGSYFGVDITADALELKTEFMREYYARQRGAGSFEELSADGQAAVADRVERELENDAPEGAIARYSAAEAYAHRRIRNEYVDRYHAGSPERGVPAGFVESASQAARIADFACWTAWMAHTDRPGSDHSYTNDWPPVPGSGNRPTGQVLVWSTISVVLLVAGGGAGVWAYHSFDFAEPTTELVDVPAPDSVSITPAQYAAARYVPVAGALFLAQVLVGAYLAHYYVERTGFYGIGEKLGIDLVSVLPFSVGRTWHINLGILWITTLWLAGGLFLPGLFADEDPPRQAEGATALLGALVVVTVGAFACVWLSMRGAFGSPEDGELWWLLGSEGLEYLETGRIWKVSLLAALVGWTGLVLRSVRRLDEPPTGLGHFMTYAGGSIALLFGASMLYTPETNIAVTEFWRWWVVHMWVEGVFEFFVTAIVAVALVSMDLLERADAEQAILFEVFAIMAAGIVGVSHHYWWVGLPDVWVPIGTTFSTLEFVPLVFVLYRSFGEYRTLRAQGEEFPYTLPLLFIVGSSVWNFVGGGVLGFFINLPVINYYEHGTYLTVAHGHTATFGAFGLLALGLGTYILRVVTPEAAWQPTWFRAAFWLTNVGLAVMSIASLLPIGFLQLRTAFQEGYAAARSLEFYERDRIQTLLWARTLGDTPMILGALAFTAGAIRHLLAARREVDSSASTATA